jgi:hypothetical protein
VITKLRKDRKIIRGWCLKEILGEKEESAVVKIRIRVVHHDE